MVIQAQRGRKTIKSKAIIDDKDDDDVEIIGDVDVTMGASDRPITAASGSDAMRIYSFSRFLLIIQSLNRSFAQMTIDNIFNGEVEAKTTPKEKGKKCATPKVR